MPLSLGIAICVLWTVHLSFNLIVYGMFIYRASSQEELDCLPVNWRIPLSIFWYVRWLKKKGCLD